MRAFPLADEHKRSTLKEQHRDDSIIHPGSRTGIVPPYATKTNVFPQCNKLLFISTATESSPAQTITMFALIFVTVAF